MRSLLPPFTFAIASMAHAQQWNWAVDAGGPSNVDFCSGIATDSHGNVYWAGNVGGTADFGCATVTSSPALAAAVLAKYDSTGACQWVRGITVGFNDAWGYGIAIDRQDRIYITGSYDGNANFGSGVTLNSLGSDDIFLARYDVEGNCIWARRAGSSGSNDEARGVAVSDSGAVFITGFSGGSTITFDGISIPNAFNYRQIIVARYDSAGVVQWAKATMGNGQGKSARAIAVANDRLYITGQIAYSAASFNGLAITPNATSSNLYVLACDFDGNALWANAYGSGDHEGMGIAADTLGNIFVTSRLWGDLQLPDDTLSSASANDDILLLGLDTAGTYRWAMSTGSAQRDLAWGAEVDGLGNAYISAHFQQSIDFFGTPFTSLGEEDVLVARVTNWGAISWVKRGGGFFRDIGLCVHRSTVGSKPIYMGGYYFGPVTYGGSTIDDVLNGDAMMIQLSDTTATDFSTTVVPQDDDPAMWLFPSPARDRLFLRTPRPVAELWVVNSLGAVIPVQQQAPGAIDVRALAPGVHFVRAVLDDGRVVGRAFVKE